LPVPRTPVPDTPVWAHPRRRQWPTYRHRGPEPWFLSLRVAREPEVERLPTTHGGVLILQVPAGYTFAESGSDVRVPVDWVWLVTPGEHCGSGHEEFFVGEKACR